MVCFATAHSGTTMFKKEQIFLYIAYASLRHLNFLEKKTKYNQHTLIFTTKPILDHSTKSKLEVLAINLTSWPGKKSSVAFQV